MSHLAPLMPQHILFYKRSHSLPCLYNVIFIPYLFSPMSTRFVDILMAWFFQEHSLKAHTFVKIFHQSMANIYEKNPQYMMHLKTNLSTPSSPLLSPDHHLHLRFCWHPWGPITGLELLWVSDWVKAEAYWNLTGQYGQWCCPFRDPGLHKYFVYNHMIFSQTRNLTCYSINRANSAFHLMWFKSWSFKLINQGKPHLVCDICL